MVILVIRVISNIFIIVWLPILFYYDISGSYQYDHTGGGEGFCIFEIGSLMGFL